MVHIWTISYYYFHIAYRALSIGIEIEISDPE